MGSSITETAALTQEERAEIRALSERATPGEWSVEGPSRGFAGYIIHGAGYVELASLLESSESDAEADAAFIAAARTALPRLLDALEAAERERDALNERLRHEVGPPEMCPSCGSCGYVECCGVRCTKFRDHARHYLEGLQYGAFALRAQADRAEARGFLALAETNRDAADALDALARATNADAA
jgi:hypothetical protein